MRYTAIVDYNTIDVSRGFLNFLELRSAFSWTVSMRLEGFAGFEQRFQAGKNAGPSVGAGSIGGVIFGPLVVGDRYFCGFAFWYELDHGA